jgi:diguanylate cyclase (GGDEF)-like protein
MYTRMPANWQQAQVAIAGILVAGCIAIILAGSVHGGASVLLGSIVLIQLLGLTGSRFPFGANAAYTLALFLIFVAGIFRMPSSEVISVPMLTIMMAVISVYVLVGNWRLEMETRRSYALMLRARLGAAQLSRRNTELDLLARHDALTGLANRRAYDTWIAAAWLRAQAGGAPLGLLVVDVDRFKLYNDFYGHPGGDMCLKTVSTCLRDQLRDTTDLVARIGGEEFAVLLPGATLQSCGDVAERLRGAIALLQQPHLGKATDRIVTVSIGAASMVPVLGWSTLETGPAELVRAADRALYAAKQGGRNCVYLATADTGGIASHTIRRISLAG